MAWALGWALSVIFNQHLIDCCLFDWSQTLLLSAFVCSRADTSHTHTYTHSLFGLLPWGRAACSICLGLVGYSGCEYCK